MVEQIHLLSKEVIRLRGQITVHPQPARDVPAYNLPPRPHRIARRCLSYIEGYGQNEEEPPKQRSHSLARECSHRPTIPLVHLTDTKNDLEKGLRRTQDIINLTTNIRWKEYFLPIQTGLHTLVAFEAHFSKTVAKFKVSINLYYHQLGLYTPVASKTHFSRAVVGDQCFTLQGGFQRPLSSFCLTFLVGRLHTPVAFGAHFFRTVLKSKVSINLYCHQSGLHTPVVFGTHFAGAAVGDQCFTLQDDFQRPLPFFCLTFSVGSKSTGTALSNPSYLSKQATYPYVRSWTHISPG
ncbi:hypothetical protein H0E87_030575 [Populus deltoides]|uniref:Uncharacterized protein n=1 Tax=Populus deltoides TaxID=3696 RepID=A0A8T2WHA3_POPDE|nr:hypothetical protein H0E87_030575 [Populus deltoides]